MVQIFKPQLGQRYKHLSLTSKARRMTGFNTVYMTMSKLVESLGNTVGTNGLKNPQRAR